MTGRRVMVVREAWVVVVAVTAAAGRSKWRRAAHRRL
jgi:hypothetical protein